MDKRKLITHEQAKSPISEAYRTLRTNLQFAKAGGAMHTILYTSSGPSEGKSTTAANTAVVLAQSGKKTLLVDCDLRKPVQHRTFGIPNRGLSNILAEGGSSTEMAQATDIPNLSVLTSGPIPPNPSELLGSDIMKQLLQSLHQDFDYVILDAPPVLAVTDACVLASWADGVVLVVSVGMDRPELAQQAKELLTNAKATIVGVVLNRVKIDKEQSYYYYYYGSDGEKRRVKK